MSALKIKSQSSKPTLFDSSVENTAAELPPYVINETEDGYRIVLNFTGGMSCSVHALLSQDGARLHLLGRKDFDDSIAKFLWIFSLPRDVEATDISVDRIDDLFVIFVPKKKNRAQLMNGFELAAFGAEVLTH